MSVVLLDCDGVICNFEATFLEILNMQTGRNHITSDITDFDFRKCVCTAAEAKEVWRHISECPGTVVNLAPYSENLQALDVFDAAGCRVICVTSPRWLCPNWMPERTKWLVNRVGFRLTDIVFTSDKSLIEGDMLIDDNYENVSQWQAKHPYGRGILLTRPWNAAFEWADRIESLAEML